MNVGQRVETIVSRGGATAESRERSASRRRRKLLNQATFWGFVGPLMLGLAVFVYAPILWGFYLSLHKAYYTVTPQDFVGFQNYLDLLRDQQYIGAISTFIGFTIVIVPITFFFALGLALLVNNLGFLQGFFRSVFFIPNAVSFVAAAIIWKASLFNGSYYGLLNALLALLHQPPVNWLIGPQPHTFPWYWLVAISLRLWIGLGFNMILFLAGLQEIPQSLYEAASVDGARRGWQTFRHITFPLLRNTSTLILVLNLIGAIQAFDEFYQLFGYGGGGSGVGGATALPRPPLVYLYSIAFGSNDFGHGTAGAFILAAIIIVFTLIQGRFVGFGRATQ